MNIINLDIVKAVNAIRGNVETFSTRDGRTYKVWLKNDSYYGVLENATITFEVSGRLLERCVLSTPSIDVEFEALSAEARIVRQKSDDVFKNDLITIREHVVGSVQWIWGAFGVPDDEITEGLEKFVSMVNKLASAVPA
jgi:hypothetical protein